MAWAVTGNIKGPKGDPGVGEPGPEGPPGPAGTSVQIQGSVANAAALTTITTKAKGDGYIAQDTGNLHVWDGTEWDDVGLIKGPKGDKGDTGTAATVSVGTTTTGAEGTAASVTQGGTAQARTLNFTIPRGATGATGPASTVPGPKGDKGDTGTRGSQWFSGAGAPGTISGAITNDKYLDTTTGDVWTF